MMIFFYIAIALLLIYGILFQYYSSWWQAMPHFNMDGFKDWKPTVKISVIVPARNEQENIANCLHSICKQNYPSHLFQIIMVDDNSTDKTFETAAAIFYDEIEIIRLKLNTPNNVAPKKRAIETGISIASGELIVTTDADCIAEPNWLRSIAAYHHQSKNVFVAAPVKIKDGKSLLSKFQALDFLTMQGITAAAVFKRFHNMCNGANLGYEKKIFYEVHGFTGIDNIASGDDMLLMKKVFRQYPQSIAWLDKALKEKQNKFDRPEDELLYAKAVHKSGDTVRAEAAYKQIIRVHHSMEGRYNYGLLLKETGRNDEAKTQFHTVVDERNLHPPHVRRINAKWVSACRKALTGM